MIHYFDIPLLSPGININAQPYYLDEFKSFKNKF